MLVDERVAETVKLALGSVLPLGRPRSVEVTGDDVRGAGRATASVSSSDVAGAIRGPLQLMASAVRDVLGQAPARMAADVAERGLFLTGGGALLRGLDRFLTREVGVSVQVAEDPRTCAVRGTRRALGEFELLHRRQHYLR